MRTHTMAWSIIYTRRAEKVTDVDGVHGQFYSGLVVLPRARMLARLADKGEDLGE